MSPILFTCHVSINIYISVLLMYLRSNHGKSCNLKFSNLVHFDVKSDIWWHKMVLKITENHFQCSVCSTNKFGNHRLSVLFTDATDTQHIVLLFGGVGATLVNTFVSCCQHVLYTPSGRHSRQRTTGDFSCLA